MEGDKQVTLHYLDLTQLSTICWRNGGRRKDRINLRDTLNSLEGARGMEEDKYIVLHYFFSFNLQKSVGGMEGEGEISFTETLNSLEEARGMEEDKYVFSLFCFNSILQNLSEE